MTHPGQLVLGPMLRHVDATSATVWVETDRPCEVEVLGHRERTWGVHGHHYALVVVDGLEPGTDTPYEVRLDGERVWPEPGSVAPPSTIRTLPRGDEGTAAGADAPPLRLAFGSCRRAAPFDPGSLRSVGADALVALALRLWAGDDGDRPDLLFLAGDQVYADDPSPRLKERLRRLGQLGWRRREGVDGADAADVAEEIVDFEEYTWLYHESWRTPTVRWLLSTVPTCMVLDDHDLRDDWNSSWSWRQQVTARSWWPARVRGALASYWVYQHLGNLSPAALADDATYAAVRDAGSDAEREGLLADLADRADAQHDDGTLDGRPGARWSFVRDLGRSRLVVVDSRCARSLRPGHRAMVDETEWAWVREQVLTARDDGVDHLLLGTSLPFLLLHGVHHLEGWDEAVAEGAWGPRGKRVGERLRLGVDLEHWAAFRRSFDDMVRLVQDVCADPGRAPASVLWLSGDVHCSYLAQAQVEGVDPGRTAVHQLTMSPFRNPLEPWVRVANRLLDHPLPVRALGRLARAAGVVDPPLRWDVGHGPWFGNGVMSVVLTGREAAVEVDHARVVGGAQVLDRTLTLPLT